ncbi:2Fe-2S iron-sulfur cluster-binding protein [uncultured Roseobacter sp.]|uniref:2Fe-2S iron-sulfur cluster-binding protein n=1 Tax=uncultured Roseobacter sp. TaxID=114847 RepID=UPI00260B6667|nr:2Fe-2S iron-sulfur cluster-binding protein [uncultured Roseobacter sp.]
MNQAKGPRSGLIVRTMRIWSGLFLLIFVTSHLLNLSLGVFSLEAMDAARPYLSEIWASPMLGPLLLSALVIHFFLGLWAIYRRPTLRTNPQDLVQLLSGVIVVPLLATHAIGVASLKINGVTFDYAAATRFFWLAQPQIGLLQVVLLSVVWVHGCAGLFTWLRSKESMRNMLGWIYPIAVAVPVLALLGFAEAGRGVLVDAQAAQRASTQAYSAPTVTAEAPRPAAPAVQRVAYQTVKTATSQVIWWSLALAALTFVARSVKIALQPTQVVLLKHGDAQPITTQSNLSILDSFRQNHQPHASLCEGRGRCGTCAVRIVSSEFPLPEPTALEMKTLRRIGAAEDVRLACQLTPSGGFLEVDPLYPADYSFKDKDFEKPELVSNPAEVPA